MAERTLTDAGIWISGYDLAGVSNSVTLNASVALLDRSTFADEGWTKRAAGLRTSAFTLSGFFDTDGPDAEQFNSIGQERSVLVAPGGEDAGDLAYVVPVAVSSHETSGSIGELVAFSYAAEGDGKPERVEVFDIREGVDSVAGTPRQELFAAAPAIGQKVDVWLHAERTSMAGMMQAELQSAAAETGGASVARATVAIADSGLYLLSYTVPDPAIKDQWWSLSLTPASGGVYDIAAAVNVS